MQKQSPNIDDSFVVQEQSPKGPFYLLPSHRIANLQNQVIFYEGQVDPLQMQNFKLKENVVRLSRQVSLSTDILRKLLPNQNDPVKKYQLQMATFSEVTESINQSWKQMQNKLTELAQSYTQLKQELQECKVSKQQQQMRRDQQKLQYQSKILQNQSTYKSALNCLQDKLTSTELQANAMKTKYEQQLRSNEKAISKYIRQLQFCNYDFNSRSKQYESTINRLKNNIQSFLKQSQQSKIAIKLKCQLLSNQKLTQQGETYESMIRLKQQEKKMIMNEMIQMKKMQQRQLQQKESQCQRIRREIQMQKSFIAQIQDELYKKRQQMKGVRNQTKQMQNQILILKENSIIVSTNLTKRQQQIVCLQNELASTISNYENKLKVSEQAYLRQINQVNRQKNKLIQLINELQVKLELSQTKVNTMEEEFAKKMKDQLQVYKEKELQFYRNIQKFKNEIEAERQKYFKLSQQKQNQIQNWKQHYQSVIKKMQKDFKKQKQQVLRQQIIRAARESSKVQQQQIKYKLQLQIQIQNINKLNEERIKRIREEHTYLMSQKQIMHSKQKLAYDQKIQLLIQQKNSLNQQISQLNKKIVHAEEKTQKMKANYIRQITRLQQKNNDTVLTWQNTLQNQLKEFQKVMMERQMKIGQIQDSFQRQKQELNIKIQNQQKQAVKVKQNMQVQIKLFKQKTGIREVQAKYEEEIKQIKAASLAKQREKYLAFLKEKNAMVEEHTKDKNNIISIYTKQLNKAQKFTEITLINIDVLLGNITQSEVQQSERRQSLSQLTNPTKIQHIQGQIKRIQEMLLQKQNQLLSTVEKLQKIQRSIQQALVQRKEQIQRERRSVINQMQAKLDSTLKQYNLSAAKKQDEYRLKYEQLQKQRVRFVQLLYQEFTTLRETHQKDYSILLQKYLQIEAHFEHRPSRGEDIAKIKQLTLKNNKLMREVHILEKRYDTANEIVKYLNLQLQNYKEMYDIFKPTDVANKTISFNFDIHKAEKYQRIISKLKDEHSKTMAKKNNHASVDITPFFQERAKEELEPKTNKKMVDNKKIIQSSEKETKLAQKSQEQQQIGLQSKQLQRKSRKYSFIPQKNRLKTEVSPNKQSEIFQNTQTFLRLANVQVNDHFPKEQHFDKKQSYRRRKIKRLTTGVQQFI